MTSILTFIFALVFSLICTSSGKMPKNGHSLTVNDFAMDLYHVLASGDNSGKNLFYSPFSIYNALAMITLGSRGNTEKELHKAMNWMDFVAGDKANKGHNAFKRLSEFLYENKSPTRPFYLANKLWLQKYFKNEYLERHFTPSLIKFYNTDIERVNFALNPENARQKINTWVENQTNNKIKNLIQPGVLSTLTRLVLTNAVYFKDTWKTKFSETGTRNMDFKVDKNTTVQVPMMFVKSKFMYGENDHCQIVELPYHGKRMSMLIFVPKEERTVEDLETFISAGVINEEINGLKEHEVTLRIPKFKLESTFNLNESLEKLGIKDLFDPSKADLSGILNVKTLYVSKVVHKAFVDVNEAGTEAAAATGIVATFRSLNPLRKFILADRPFIFGIREMRSGVLLFVGKVVNPSKA